MRSKVTIEPGLATPSLTMGDVYYILFRHKWKILLCTLVGILAAGAVLRFFPPAFESEAKLFIRYVISEGKPTGPTGDDATMKSPDQRGETIMEGEVEILGSLDLAKNVAEIIGPEKILSGLAGSHDVDRAAMTVKNGLKIDVPPSSSVIRIVFKHHDPAIVQPVLSEVIEQYRKKHLEIHSAVGILGDVMTRETDQLRTSLAQTEDDLRKAKSAAGIISLEGAKRNYADQIDLLQREIFAAQDDVAERSAEPPDIPAPSVTATPSVAAAADIPAAAAEKYREIVSRLDVLRRNEQDLLNQFTEQSSRVVDVRALISDAEGQRQKLVDQYPGLVRVAVAAANGAPPTAPTRPGYVVPLVALQSKVNMLVSQLAEVRTEAANLEKVETSIDELQRRKDLEEEKYKFYSASLEQARINEALGNGRVSNISQIQTPSPPIRDTSKFVKILGGIAFSGLAFGLAWAFSIEMIFDRSIRRPVDIERTIGLPLFLSIPRLRKKLLRAPKKWSALPAINAPATESKTAAPNETNVLQVFHETLRDRLIGYFESINLTHKPKLIAVTGLGKGSGVTTTAAGLARSLSETGESNVLLVDMTAGQGSAHQFYKGKPTELEEIFSTRDRAQVQEKLFVVSEEPGTDRLSRILPQRFTTLVPKLKASDFDYIIFDMPPVSQLSVTPRLAGFMDMVMFVVESEKTDRDVVKRATDLLEASNAHVGIVLNKTRSYVPTSVHQEHLLNS
jgi:polysaccharide biosynthesis transport protein